VHGSDGYALWQNFEKVLTKAKMLVSMLERISRVLDTTDIINLNLKNNMLLKIMQKEVTSQ
jgi:hypothetical protein